MLAGLARSVANDTASSRRESKVGCHLTSVPIHLARFGAYSLPRSSSASEAASLDGVVKRRPGYSPLTGKQSISSHASTSHDGRLALRVRYTSTTPMDMVSSSRNPREPMAMEPAMVRATMSSGSVTTSSEGTATAIAAPFQRA